MHGVVSLGSVLLARIAHSPESIKGKGDDDADDYLFSE
jgi:hypothetical protein